MNFVSTKISYWFLKKAYITENQVDDIRYALEVVFSNFLSFISILFLGSILNQYIKMFVFFIVFIGFRTLRDRYHAPTFMKCYFLTVGSFLLCLIPSAVISRGDQLLFTIYAITLNIIYLIMFRESINEGQDDYSNAIYNVIFVVYNLLCMVLSGLGFEEYSAFASVLGTIIIVTSIVKQKEE